MDAAAAANRLYVRQKGPARPPTMLPDGLDICHHLRQCSALVAIGAQMDANLGEGTRRPDRISPERAQIRSGCSLVFVHQSAVKVAATTAASALVLPSSVEVWRGELERRCGRCSL